MNETLDKNELNKLLVDYEIVELNTDPKYAAARDLFYKFLLEVKTTGVDVTYESILAKINEIKTKTLGYSSKI